MWKFIKKLFYTIAIISIFSIIWGRFFNPIITITQIEGLVKYQKLDRDYISFDEMGRNVKKAVIASEDQNFYRHNGFDFQAIQKAFADNQKGKKLKGGSTISQQTAKNVFLWQGRSYVRKGLEAYFTVLIELVWGKERIMEVYLNSIEMGDGVYGAQAAAKHWYKKEAKNLTKYEAAGIAAILPNPRRFKATNSSSYINKRKAKISKYIGYVKLDY